MMRIVQLPLQRAIEGSAPTYSVTTMGDMQEAPLKKFADEMAWQMRVHGIY